MSDREEAPAPIRIYRYFRLLFHLLAGLLTVALLFPAYARERRWRAIQRWAAGILSILNVRLEVKGAPPASGRPLLGVANHVSWLDIYVIHAAWRVRFVAKSEVRDWPAIGWLSAKTGTLFIERGRHRHAAHINRAIHEAFALGDAIAVFPEGTTTHGTELRRFHASLLQPAVDENALVVPVALRYANADGSVDVTPSYVGDTSLMESIVAIVSQRQTRVELAFLTPIDASGRRRREVAAAAQAAVAKALRLPDPGSAPGTGAGLPGASPTAGVPTGSRCPVPSDSR
jgi:1-acyl-sn-glycerol-3-phosphate acyltransferase